MAEVLNINELAQRIKVSRWTIYAWVSSKFIPHIKLRGRLLFNWDDVEKWIAKNSVPGRTVQRLKIEEKIQESTHE